MNVLTCLFAAYLSLLAQTDARASEDGVERSSLALTSSDFYVKASSIPGSGDGLYAARDLPKGSFLFYEGLPIKCGLIHSKTRLKMAYDDIDGLRKLALKRFLLNRFFNNYNMNVPHYDLIFSDPYGVNAGRANDPGISPDDYNKIIDSDLARADDRHELVRILVQYTREFTSFHLSKLEGSYSEKASSSIALKANIVLATRERSGRMHPAYIFKNDVRAHDEVFVYYGVRYWLGILRNMHFLSGKDFASMHAFQMELSQAIAEDAFLQACSAAPNIGGEDDYLPQATLEASSDPKDDLACKVAKFKNLFMHHQATAAEFIFPRKPGSVDEIDDAVIDEILQASRIMMSTVVQRRAGIVGEKGVLHPHIDLVKMLVAKGIAVQLKLDAWHHPLFFNKPYLRFDSEEGLLQLFWGHTQQKMIFSDFAADVLR